MSLKNLFKDQSAGNAKTSLFEDQAEVESRDTVVAVLNDKDEVIPNIDFSKPDNFAKFGSAEYYYIDSIDNIYKNYPYDGSKKDKQEWYNSLAIFEKYLFDNEYPKTNGYIKLSSNQYVAVRPSSQPITAQDTGSFTDKNLPANNIYDTGSNKIAPFYLNNSGGNTVEFWFKETSNVRNTYALVDIWNSASAASSNYHRLLIEVITGSGFYLTYRSGSNDGLSRQFVDVNYSSLKDNWHHYAFSFTSNTSSNKIDTSVYIDGFTNKSTSSKLYSFSSGSSINNSFSSKNLICNIGSYLASISGVADDGSGSVYGNFDEFRFWKESRNHKQIGRNWFTQVDGGTNSTSSNSNLDLYYKFNEGIVSTGSTNNIDSIVLDYSGRFTNATIKNYNYSVRSTGSAINESLFFDFNEPKDPIIISVNPVLTSFKADKQLSGSNYDSSNSSIIYNLFPTWMREEDEIGNQELKNISQVLSSYFDKLYLQIQLLSSIKYNDYNTNLEKPIPFAKNLLESKSLIAPELFLDSTIIEEVFAKNDERPFEEKLSNIRNLIYKNIYNNLTYIYKSKGTEKSFRNMFRTFGIDDEILKFVVYSNNADIDLSRNRTDYSTAKKSLIDLSFLENHEATIYQTVSGTNPSAVSHPNSYLSSSVGNTFECQILFPNIDDKKDLLRWNVSDLSASIFGAHSALSTGSDTTWDSIDSFNYQVYAVRDSYGSKGARFFLKTDGFGVNTSLSSSFYSDVYDNTQWNFAVRLKPSVNDYSYLSNSAGLPQKYTLEFYGVQVNADIIQSEFSSSLDVTISNALTALGKNKRFYLGAHRTNFTGSVLQKSDIRVINSRFWLNYLDNETIKNHAKNFKNYSAGNASKRSYFGLYENITPLDTLVFNWDFNGVTGSDSTGKFIVKDVKLSTTKNNDFASITNKYYFASGFGFLTSSTQIVDYDYLPIVINKLPEEFSTSDSIQIVSEDDVLFTKDSRPVENYVSIENSMYSVISQEMMNMFSSINEFNNLIANPLNLYKKDYKEIAYLRNIFFEKVNNIPNFEKYLNLFKWIDSSIGEVLKQITPANANVSDQISNILESHILERNKHQRRLPFLQEARKILSYPIKGVQELSYSWISGSAPISADTSSSGLWLKERAERAGPFVSSSNSIIDQQRQILLNSINNNNGQTSYKLSGSNGSYTVTDYFLTKTISPYKIIGVVENGLRADNQMRRINRINQYEIRRPDVSGKEIVIKIK